MGAGITREHVLNCIGSGQPLILEEGSFILQDGQSEGQTFAVDAVLEGSSTFYELIFTFTEHGAQVEVKSKHHAR